jgi:hypothetical protein
MGSKDLITGLIFFMVLSVTTSCSFSKRACRNLLEESMEKKYDIVIVPGVPFENGKWSFVMKSRVYWSKYLYDKGITKNVIYSGAAVYSPYCEAEIMALYAAELGIPEENIFTETLAEHSTENVYYSYKKARKLGFEHIALASDQFQTKMLKRFTRKIVSREVGLIPIVIDTLEAMQPSMIDPEIDYQKAFREDFTPLPDRKNMRDRFRGTRGLDIDKSVYE